MWQFEGLVAGIFEKTVVSPVLKSILRPDKKTQLLNEKTH